MALSQEHVGMGIPVTDEGALANLQKEFLWFRSRTLETDNRHFRIPTSVTICMLLKVT